MNCLDSNAGEPTKAAAFEEDDAPIGVPALLYEGSFAEAELEAGMEALHDVALGTIRTVLPRDGGSQLKGMNSLKSGGVFQGRVGGPAARRARTRNLYLTCAS
ncbi:hypothetical protein CRG98_025983 [Punica granatum]|uniref:Uncharacterized protein n=1 Tax=Punica granatum TaxID=22663 RepID=A0A2I0JBK8_PUNGR|nr:hypothetical protein CRG98_025983 [Punica granatum]